MTAVAAPQPRPVERQGWFGRNRIGLHTAIIVLMVIWAIPTVALLINSVRPGDVASGSGWWTAFFPPYTFSFENYNPVLGGLGSGPSFSDTLF